MKQKVIVLGITVLFIAALLYATQGVRSATVSATHKQSKLLSVAESAAEAIKSMNVGTAPTLFSYQGQLLDSSGNPVSGSRSMIFRLYDALTGGMECWSETQNVTIDNGLFNVLLGASTPIDATGDCFAGDLYLELEIGGQALSPRELLTSLNVPDGSRLGTAVVGQDLTFANDEFIAGTPNGSIFGPDNGWLNLAADSSPLLSNGSWFRGGWIWLSSVDSTINPGSVRIHLVKDTALNNSPFFQVIRIEDDGDTASLMNVDQNGVMTIPDTLRINGAGSPRVVFEQSASPNIWRIMANSGGNLKLQTNPGSGWQDVMTLFSDGTCSLSQGSQDLISLEVESRDPCHGIQTDYLETGSLQTGAIIEANLPLPQAHDQLFSQGGVLCISAKTYELELCTTANDRLVQAVANAIGQAVVMGAEPIKVIGEVHVGDILVTSHIPGYAMVNNTPTPGTVIGQALEDFTGKSGLIQAMIRKW